jgi:hypothetical protein
MDHSQDVLGLLAAIVQSWFEVHAAKLDFEASEYFVRFEDSDFGPLRTLAPVAQLDKNPSGWPDHPSSMVATLLRFRRPWRNCLKRVGLSFNFDRPRKRTYITCYNLNRSA